MWTNTRAFFDRLVQFSATFLKRQSLFSAIVVLLTIGSAAASTIAVNRTSDTVGNDGRCTLREAIIAANTNTASGTLAGECVAGSATEADTIVFNLPNINELCPISGCVIGLQTALPEISSSMVISGPMIIQPAAGANIRVLYIHLPFGTGVVLSDLTIRNGRSPSQDDFGGGIRVNASGSTVTVSNCLLINNSSREGAGIFLDAGTLSITHSTIINNHADCCGGGILNQGDTVVSDSEISGNSAVFYGGGIFNSANVSVTESTISGNVTPVGGGIYSETINGTVNITNSTIKDNFSSGVNTGGGIHSESSGESLNIVNSTINHNVADADGGVGGINCLGAELNLVNSTVTDNHGGGGGGSGGISVPSFSLPNNITNSTIARNIGRGLIGFRSTSGGGSLRVKSTIIAQNSGSDVDGTNIESQGFNLIGNASEVPFTVATDLTGTSTSPLDPKLGPLADNGGPTETMALLTGSPAIDKGTSGGLTGTLIADQRGVGYARKIDKSIGNASGGDGSDIGAVESGAQIKVASRKNHPSAGLFDVTLPLFGPTIGVECRKGGSSHVLQLVLNFPRAVTVASTSVTPDPAAPGATGSISSFSVNGKVVTVNLTGVSNAQRLLVTLFGVSDGTNTNDVAVPMGVLFGDTNKSGSVSDADVTLTRSKVGQVVNATNFREDVDLSGTINSTDVNMVTSNKGKKLP